MAPVRQKEGEVVDPTLSWAKRIQLMRCDAGAGISVSRGIEPAPREPVDGGEAYVERSFVPREEIRPCEPSEIAVLTEPSSQKGRLPIGIVRIPPAILTKIANAARDIWSDDGSFWTKRKGQAILDGLLEDAGLTMSGSVKGLGPSRRPPGLRSTTYERRHGLRIGLHIDSWDASGLWDRGGTRNRLCLNLGRTVHYLYLVPLLPAEILESIGRARDDDTEPDEIVREFCARHPRTEVLRLDVPPGFAYVAPTDAMIHDGGAAPSTSQDIILTWLGHFGFREDWPSQGQAGDRPSPGSGDGI